MSHTTQEKALPLRIRHAIDSDVPFIFNSWLKSFRETGTLCRGVNNVIYFAGHHKLIQKIVQRSMTYVAYSAEDPMQTYGYIVGEFIQNVFVLHFAYVKHSFRKFGIAKLLLEQFNIEPGTMRCYTHQTRTAEKLAPRYEMIYHPYVMIVDYYSAEEQAKMTNKAEHLDMTSERTKNSQSRG